MDSPPSTPPPQTLKVAECEALTGNSTRQRLSPDPSLERRLFHESSLMQLQWHRDPPADSIGLLERRFTDGGRSQWVFLDGKTEDEGLDDVVSQEYCASPSVGEPRVRVHATRAERRWRTLLVCALHAASLPSPAPCHAYPSVPFAFRALVRACAARAAPGGLATCYRGPWGPAFAPVLSCSA